MLRIFIVGLSITSVVQAYAAEERYIEEASTFDLYPFTVDKIKSYYGQRLKESDFACKLPETAAMRPPKGMDCRSWTAPKVLLGGKIEVDSVVYGATVTGLVRSFTYKKSNNCSIGLRDFLYLQGSFFKDGNAKVIGFEYGEDGHISKGNLSMDGQLMKPGSYKHLELEYRSEKCTLTYAYQLTE